MGETPNFFYKPTIGVEQSRELTKQEVEKTKEIFKPKIPTRVMGINHFTEGIYGSGEIDDPKEKLEQAELVAMGDAHGSALKILETAILSGLTSMPEKEAKRFRELYKQMIKLCNEPDFDEPNKYTPFSQEKDRVEFKKYLAELLDILEKINWIGSERKFIILGDTICDRGLLDIITMRMIKKMREKGGNVEVISSNHDVHLTFEKRYRKITWGRDMFPQTTRKYFGTIGKVNRMSEVKSFAVAEDQQKLQEEYAEYIGQLKLFYYDEKTQTLFCHACITQTQIRKLSLWLGCGLTPKNIPIFIEKANKWFTQTIQKPESALDEIDMSIIKELLWQRGTTNLTDWEKKGYRSEKEIPLNESVQNLVHGHDNSDLSSPFCTISKHKTGKANYNYDPTGHNIFNLNNHYRRSMKPDDELKELEPNSLFTI